MNIAQAAAAGLLDVPGKESTLPQVNVPQVNIQAPAPASTQPPAEAPIHVPTQAPTKTPIQAPTQTPIQAPTQAQTQAPTQAPTTIKPSAVPKFTFVAGNAASVGPEKQQADIKTSAVGFTPLPLSTAQATPFAFQPSPATTVSSNPTTGKFRNLLSFSASL